MVSRHAAWSAGCPQVAAGAAGWRTSAPTMTRRNPTTLAKTRQRRRPPPAGRWCEGYEYCELQTFESERFHAGFLLGQCAAMAARGVRRCPRAAEATSGVVGRKGASSGRWPFT